MTKDSFRSLFDAQLEIAAQRAEQVVGHAVPRSFIVELHGASGNGRRLSPSDGVDLLYLGSSRFYRIVDLGIFDVTRDTCFVRANVSGHMPDVFEKTWNNPPGSGPFKQIHCLWAKLR